MLVEADGWCGTHAKREADKLSRQIVLTRDGNRCRRCGYDGKGVQWAHIFTRAELSIRWDSRNAVALCAACHQMFTLFPMRWLDWVDEQMPGRLDELRAIARFALETGWRPDYQQVIAKLRAEVKGGR